jgi:hypothetical protein
MRSKVTPNSAREFLLRLDSDGHYFVAADGHDVGVTRVLSVARHFPLYASADQLCQHYRRRGYKMACVTRESGSPVVEADLAANR